MRRLVLAVALLVAWGVPLEAAPRLEVGQVYEIIWSCQSTLIPTDDAPIRIQTCFSEFLRVRGKGNSDWYEVEDRSGERWFININQALAVRKAILMPAPAHPESPRTIPIEVGASDV